MTCGIYEKAAEVAERSLAVDPDSGYALTDVVASEDALITVFYNDLSAQMFVEGTLTGCVAAIRQTPGAAALLALIAGHPPVPTGTIIEPIQFDHAISWLKRSVAGDLDADQRSSSVSPVVFSDSDLTHRSALVLALVTVTDATCQEARARNS